jgi:uncharacterized membrane protein (DUF4010 family)
VAYDSADSRNAMKLAARIALANGAAVLGCFLALFIVPRTIPLKLFLPVCAAAIVLINGTVFWRARNERKQQKDSGRRGDRFRSATIWITLAILMLMEFLLNHTRLSSYLH